MLFVFIFLFFFTTLPCFSFLVNEDYQSIYVPLFVPSCRGLCIGTMCLFVNFLLLFHTERLLGVTLQGWHKFDATENTWSMK